MRSSRARLRTPPPVGRKRPRARQTLYSQPLRGRSSAVERQPSKLNVASSILVARFDEPRRGPLRGARRGFASRANSRGQGPRERIEALRATLRRMRTSGRGPMFDPEPGEPTPSAHRFDEPRRGPLRGARRGFASRANSRGQGPRERIEALRATLRRMRTSGRGPMFDPEPGEPTPSAHRFDEPRRGPLRGARRGWTHRIPRRSRSRDQREGRIPLHDDR